MHVVNDRSQSIRASVNEVQFTLTLTIGLVVLVIFLFLRRVSATVIPALALPVSLIGTCAGMYMLGYSIDNLSLLALTLSVGFVVDDAIVMLENIVRHVETRRAADAGGASTARREIGFTIVSMTLSLVAVFIPVLFMGGVVGRALPRVRGHHHRDDPDLRLRLAHVDADAVQPLPALDAGIARPLPARARGRASMRCSAPIAGAWIACSPIAG